MGRRISVEVDINEFDTDMLVEELESRNIGVHFNDEISADVMELFELRRCNSAHFDAAFANFVYTNIGRVL